MADKGLISKSTLQGFADEVRRLAGSEQTGTPAEMLALLQAVETGGNYEKLTGKKQLGSAMPARSIDLGVYLPVYNNYVFMIFRGASGTATDTYLGNAVTLKVDGSTTYYACGSDSTYMETNNRLEIKDFSVGTISFYYTSNGVGGFSAGTYTWTYVGWD